MSDNQQDQLAQINPNQGDNQDGGKKIDFVQTYVVKRALRRVGNTGQKPKLDLKARYLELLAKAQPTLDAADRALQESAGSKSIAKARQDYTQAASAHTSVDPAADYGAAITLLRTHQVEAGKLLKAAAGREARLAQSRQVRAQVTQYEALGKAWSDVKRSTMTDGTTVRIASATPKANEPAFAQVIKAMGALEKARSGIQTKPEARVDAQKATLIQGACADLIKAAQDYIRQADTLNPAPVGEALDAVNTKKRRCEEAIKLARQLSLAMDYDKLPEPSSDAPWDEENQIRATGLRAALAFEQGGQKATGLSGAGNSSAYWVRDKDIGTLAQEQGGNDPSSGERLFIFKPTGGEEFPAGCTDKRGAGAVKEAMAGGNARLFAAQTGIDFGVPETSVVSLPQDSIEDGNPLGPNLVGSAQRNANASGELRETDPSVLARVPKEDIHKIALMDIMSLSMDRHGGNIMVDTTTDPNTPHLVPIDHGGTLPSRDDFPEVKQRMAGMVYKPVQKELEQVNVLLANPAAYESFDPKMLAQLGRLDPEAMEAGMKRQRDALGSVHPELDPKDKLSDQSLHMSKRAMMFLKLAAPTLSPAEIQLALAVHGEALFDAKDNDFAKLAQDIIDEQAPKKAAYQEIMFMPQPQMLEIADWLLQNGWYFLSDIGAADPMGFLMRDPVGALRLYKTQKPNPNPPPVVGDPKIPALPPNPPDEQTRQAMLDEFPSVAAVKTDYDWRAMQRNYDRAMTLGGSKEYNAALRATGTEAQNDMAKIAEVLYYWDPVRKANAQDAIPLSATARGAAIMLKIAANASQVALLNGQALGDAGNAASTITENDALAASVQMLAGKVTDFVKTFKDGGLIQKFNTALHDANQKAQNSDLAGAEQDLRLLLEEARAAQIADLRLQFKKVAGKTLQLFATRTAPEDFDVEGEKRQLTLNGDVIEKTKRAGDAQKIVESARRLYKTIKENWADNPNAPPQVDPQQQNNAQLEDDTDEIADQVDDTQQDDKAEEFEGAPIDDVQDPPQDNAPQQPKPIGPLGSFDWHESSARAVVAFAVAQGMFKKKKTGLGENIRAVKDARKTLDSIRPTTKPARKIEYLQAAVKAYDRFGLFVASRLRLLTDDERWQDYCNLAADEVVARLKEVRTELEKVNGGN